MDTFDAKVSACHRLHCLGISEDRDVSSTKVKAAKPIRAGKYLRASRMKSWAFLYAVRGVGELIK